MVTLTQTIPACPPAMWPGNLVVFFQWDDPS